MEARQLTEKGAERKRLLLELATGRFAENGFHRTSVAEIVDGVGVGKGVFYWYFASKDDLLREILRDALFNLRAAQATAIAKANDPLQKIEAGIRATMEWSAKHPEILKIVMFAWSEENFAGAMRRGREIMVSDTAQLIQQAIDLGQIIDGNAFMMATALRGITDELSREYALVGSAQPSDLIDTAVRVGLNGLQG